MKERFLIRGLKGFHHFEVIELLPTLGTPRSDCKQAAKDALKKFGSLNAAALIFVHNHPIGNLNPSEEDIKITKKLKEAVSTIDVNVHVHLIIAGNDYYSFAHNKLI